MSDFKEIVKESYLPIIKATFTRFAHFQIDSLMNDLLRLHIAEPKNADEVLVATDKFFIYKSIWQGILETLYKTYLPDQKYTFKWIIEITPYTMMLCELSKDHIENEELNIQMKILGYTKEQMESQYDTIIEQMGFKNIALQNILSDTLPQVLIPSTKTEQLVLIFRLMNFPPLGELAIFLNHYNAYLKKQVETLSTAFNGIEQDKIPSFGMQECLHYSWFHLDHIIFNKYGLDKFEQDERLSDYKEDFKRIRNLVESNKDKFKDNIICPCCGEKEEITLPEEILQYKYLLEQQELSKKIGLLYLNEFTDNFLKNLSDLFSSFFPNINKVDNPDCIILVEGSSEEVSIPILAFRKRFILSHKNIQVYNSKSKEKLEADFFSLKTKYPNKKIICLLDSDAQKERDNIQRVANEYKNKYRLILIDKGTFEDIFDLDSSILVLNELYPEGERIVKEDFDPLKDFLLNINSILFKKKKAKFDKVLFAKTISLKMDISKIPKEIDLILKIAKDFIESKKYVKR